MRPSRLAALSAFLRARFSAEGYLGLHLTVGVLVLMVSAFIFGNIAEDVVTADAITILDVQLSQWMHAHTRPGLTRFMMALTDLHSTAGIALLGLLLALYWWRIKAWDWLLTLLLVLPVGMLLNMLLKQIFHRARPSFEVPLLTLSSYSFPSGHTAGATLFYGVLAAWLMAGTTSWRWRLLIASLAFVLVGLVGLSRIYLGVHYLSDVLAAMAASSGWLAICLTAVDTVRRRRRWQQTKA